ncbi:hypothetical protein PT974_08875 [Cladobotryum mycophilum]|uniref:Secondary alcohol dehydrogenase n=1 Tax=Cladobotryum mycophilum TaxID=491253 RepID=A0ABR0SFZ2_9HYPO
MSSADPTPISPSRFAAALKDLSVGMLHLKVLEIRNSIAHLQYSNDQLKPFAEGSATALGDNNDASVAVEGGEPDQDCIDAIRENEQVIDRMAERLAIIRAEVEERGVSWTEFQSKDEVEKGDDDAAAAAEKVNGEGVNGHVEEAGEGEQTETRHSAWTDGTFQTGTISSGQVHLDSQPGRPNGGGSLSDEQLRARLAERMRNLEVDGDDDDEEGGLHL